MFSDKLLDRVLQKKKNIDDASSFKRCVLLVSAITIHNIPEGMAVGIVFAGTLDQGAMITLAGAFVLSIGIAIQVK